MPTYKYGLSIYGFSDTFGKTPVSGLTVQLRGDTILYLTELNNSGYYQKLSVPDGLYQVWENSSGSLADSGQAVQVGLVMANGLADGAVESSKLADSAVGNSKLAPGAVSHSKIGDHVIDTNNIAYQAIIADVIAPGAVIRTKLGDLAVDGSKLAEGSVSGDIIAHNSILQGKLAHDAVQANNIEHGAVLTNHLADESVSHTKIADGAIMEQHIQDDEISDSKIKDGVSAEKINTGLISNAEFDHLDGVRNNIDDSISSLESVAFSLQKELEFKFTTNASSTGTNPETGITIYDILAEFAEAWFEDKMGWNGADEAVNFVMAVSLYKADSASSYIPQPDKIKIHTQITQDTIHLDKVELLSLSPSTDYYVMFKFERKTIVDNPME